ncbi:MAG: LPXTG cell wall anchor domain-containing protein [Bacillaceae bacterium]|nr:LPXTG cell wall anchor domain-containing protein [Bacillaceae bacterium]
MSFRILFSLGLFAIMILVYTPLFKTGANEVPEILSIDTFPKEKFINLDNLKPGDKIRSAIEVQNTGNINFSYRTIAEFNGGSKKYYDVLTLEVLDENNQPLYSGSLKDFQGLSERKLSLFSKEKLYVNVEVPHELGNEYQGLSTGMKLTFFAEDQSTPVTTPNEPIHTGGNGSELPKTATNLYNLLLLGLLFVSGGTILFWLNKRNRSAE